MGRSSLVQAQQEVPWQEPVQAYRRLRAGGHQPFLLDGNGRHPEARFAFLGLRPLVEVRITGHDIEERWMDGAVEVRREEPLGYLRRMVARYHFVNPEAVPFTGGWLGLFGFGFAQNIEPCLAATESGMRAGPDALLRLCLDVVAFDRKDLTATLYCADLEGDIDACQARAADLQAQLAAPLPPSPAAGTPPPSWQTSLDEQSFEVAAQRLIELIRNGDLFQANLATRFSAPCATDPPTLFAALQAVNPSPYMALVECADFAVVSGSPEQLFCVREGRISSRPIAGTRKRGADPVEDALMESELLADPKEQAEHTMLVDLVRNDIARVSKPGTVRVTETGSIERYSHVMHLASRVEGQLRDGTGLVDWLAALFPGGTVTGAPKVRATERILAAEPVARGFYTGSAGYLSWSQNAAWNILIRTVQIVDGQAHVHAGSGIVADSDPGREWREAGRKAQALLDAATGGSSAAHATRLGDVVKHGAWQPPVGARRHADKRVLVIDNYDSFVHNLADYCALLGATVRVVRNDVPWRAAVAEFAPTHIILSPGPGWPEEAGCIVEMARELDGHLPILGVCLGHQAIGRAAGAVVRVHGAGPVHGKADEIHHVGAGLFTGLASPLTATRYHSLVVDAASVPPEWAVDATLRDGTVMALRHRRHPTFGLQFHPESLCTPRGLELLDRFLETKV